MDIIKMGLTGWIGIRKGMGLESIEIDFTGRDGVIALAGPTGRGKTTIIENCQPFALSVSRPKSALKNHVCPDVRNAKRVLDFVMGNRLIETLIKVDGQTGRAEGFINIDGNPQTTGKISEYHKAIVDIVGSPELFFQSAFAPQNGTKISGLRPGELKSLVAEFLGGPLRRLSDQEEHCKSLISALQVERDNLRGQMLALVTRRAAIGDVAGAIALEYKKLATSAKQTEQYNEDIATLKSDLSGLKKTKAAGETAEVLVRELLEQRRGLVAEKEAYLREHESEVTELKNQSADIDRKIQELIPDVKALPVAMDAEQRAARLSADLERLDERRAALELMESGEVGRLADKKKALELKRSAIEVDLAALEVDHADAVAAVEKNRNEVAWLTEEHAAVWQNEEYLDLKATEAELKTIIAHTKDIECPKCGHHFGTDAAEKAKKKMTKVSFDLEACKRNLQAEQDDLDAKIEALAAQTDSLKKIEQETGSEFSNAQAEVDRLDHDIKQVWLSLDDASDRYREQRAELTKERNATSEALRHQKTLADNLDKYTAAKARADQARLDREAVDRKIEALEDPDGAPRMRIERKVQQITEIDDRIRLERTQIDDQVDLEIARTMQGISAAEAMLTELAVSAEKVRAQIARLEASADELRGINEELNGLNDDEAKVTSALSDWGYLRHATGANGLRALEIEAAMPAVAAQANYLLAEAFGNTAGMVEFRTVSDDGREVLEPCIVDKDGDLVLVADRSGGQQVYALKAMRLGMTLLANEKSGRHFSTAFADEDDAGLDVETAIAYTDMDIIFRQLGGFQKLIRISHKPESISKCDHVFNLSGGGHWES
jgi:exonuclease SbcC